MSAALRKRDRYVPLWVDAIVWFRREKHKLLMRAIRRRA